MTAIRWIIGILIGIAALVLLAGGVLFVATMGDYAVRGTVDTDRSLEVMEVDGVRLHSRIVGPELAPVIVVLHGGPGGDFRSLQGLDALADSYRVVFYDQRGAGLSERVGAFRLDLDGYLAELDGVIAAVSPDAPVILVGHSWGAMLAIAYLGHAPDSVSRAVLIEPGFIDAEEAAAWQSQAAYFTSGPKFMWHGLVTSFRAMHVSGPDALAAEDFMIGTMVKAFLDDPANPYHCPGQISDAPSWRFGAVASDAASRTPPREFDRIARGTAYPGPVLFLSGACNIWIGPDLQAQHAARFANAETRTIEGAGHEVIWEQPEAALAAIRAFLDKPAG